MALAAFPLDFHDNCCQFASTPIVVTPPTSKIPVFRFSKKGSVEKVDLYTFGSAQYRRMSLGKILEVLYSIVWFHYVFTMVSIEILSELWFHYVFTMVSLDKILLK